MPLKELKNKITNIVSSEILGEADVSPEANNSNPGKPSKPSKSSKPSKLSKAGKPSKPDKPTNKRRNQWINKEEQKTIKQHSDKDGNKSKKENVVVRADDIVIHEEGVMRDGYQDVLSILGIKEHLEIDVDFTSHDLDYINFGQTTPLGLDADEVADFISRAKYTFHKLETAIKQRERDVVKIASEVKKIENKMMEQNHAKELDRMTNGSHEEKLIQEIMEMRVDINELSKKNEKLTMENKKLKQKLNSNVVDTQKIDQNKATLPVPPIEDEDPFSEMLDNIGGLYDE